MIWWTVYILVALTILIIWINLMGLLGRLLKVIRDKEWGRVKVVEGPPGPQGPTGPKGESCTLSRKDIESLIRMEIVAHLNRLEFSRTTYPGLGKDEIKIGLREEKGLGDWQTNQPKVDVDKLIDEYRNKKEDK
nr:MAG TPA: PROTEIN (MANNOSE-BINDING PROTEIN A), HOST DEFENSE, METALLOPROTEIN, SUGAR.9A [Caudoviricetes sp.]